MPQDPFQRLNARLLEVFSGVALEVTHALHIGNPKGPTNQRVRNHLVQHLDLDQYHPLATLPELKDAIINYNQRVHGVKLSREQVTAVQGTKSALAWLPSILQSRGKTAAIPDLSYPTYFSGANANGTNIEFYSADNPLKFELPRNLSHFIITSPHNPLGRVSTREELAHLAGEAQRKNFVLVSDECYIDIYTGKKPTSLLEVDTTGEFRNLLVFNSLSKSANVPGLRSGVVAGDSKLVKQFASEYATTGNTLSKAHQEASALAWQDFDFIAENRARYQTNLRHFSNELGLPVPEGAFYFFIDTGRDGEHFVVDMLRKHKIKLMPGKYLDFKGSGRWDNYVRVPVAEKFGDDVMGALKDELRH